MCGIAVSVDMTGRRRAALWAIPDMRHRGPDGEGTLRKSDGNVVLEHTRLAIIDPDNHEVDQPFTDPSGRWSMVFNGEIFNFRDLRKELEARGIRFRTSSDTEVLLHGFILEGEGILRRLRGMFVVAVWDSETRELFLARDHMGIKPLYYAQPDGMLLAASEIRTLLAHPFIRPSLDPAAVVHFLSFGYLPGEATLVQGIRTLLPGHAARIRDGRLERLEYWDPLPEEPLDADGESVAEELRGLLQDAVAAALPSEVPMGFTLSGGLDSSTVAALAARLNEPSELTAYTVSVDAPDDESPMASRLARDLGLRHREIRLTTNILKTDFDAWLSRLDQPCYDPAWLATTFIARAARNDGVKVLLSGDGGDVVYGASSRSLSVMRFHDRVWTRIPPPLRTLSGRLARPFLKDERKDVARRAAVGGELLWWPHCFHHDLLARCLGPTGREALASFPPEAHVYELRERFRERGPWGDYSIWVDYLGLKTWLPGDVLPRLHKMATPESVEVRVPLLDPNLIHWCLSIPRHLKLEDFRPKALLRRAVSDLLPPYILERPKHGFTPPVVLWATQFLSERGRHDAALLEDSGLLVRDAWSHVERETDRSPYALWGLGTLAAWCARNL